MPRLASAAADQWVRGVGRGHSLDIRTTSVYGFGAVCSRTDMCAQPLDATITTVSAAAKSEHDLPSTTIAKKVATFTVGSPDARRFCIGTTRDPMCGPGGTMADRD